MKEFIYRIEDNESDESEVFIGWIRKEGHELIRCRDCKHRPKFVKPEDDDDRGYLLFPDNKCPCRCEDEWYNWMPKKDWYCGNAERKEE